MLEYCTMTVPEIRTERVRLRGLTSADYATLNDRLFADPEVIRYLPLDGPLSSEQLDGSLDRSRQHWGARGFGVWALCDLPTDEVIGHCGLRHLDEVDEVEILYAIARSYWGRGLVTEAAGAALRFGFEEAGLQRIVAYAVPENAP